MTANKVTQGAVSRNPIASAFSYHHKKRQVPRIDKEFNKERIEARSTHALGPRTTITLPPFYHGTTT